MADLTTLARPYAKAAFQVAQAQQALAKWSAMLGLLSELSKQDKIQQALNSPKQTVEQKVQLFAELCADAIDAACLNFIQLLAENKRLNLLAEVSALFEIFKNEAEKLLNVEVVSAQSLNTSIQEQLAQALNKKLNCQVNIITTVDASLLGGAIIRAGDLIIDNSVRNRLNKLAQAIQL